MAVHGLRSLDYHKYKGWEKEMKKLRAPYVSIEFLDHCESDGDKNSGLVPAEVVGRLYHEDKTAYKVASWIFDQDLTDGENKIFTIAKATVTRIRRLK